MRLIAGLLFSMSGVAVAQQPAPPPGLDAYVAQVLEEFEVPGVGIGIVKDGQVVLAKGYGIKRLGNPDRVDENTLFSIASNSKAFTATALALLIEDGKLEWEDRVVDYLPWFELSDAYVTQHLTVRDLLVHHSGLPAYANDLLLFPPSTFSRKELLSKLKDVPLDHDFRSVYAYDNILYVAAGEVIETVSGMEWETFIKQRIFDRVGMPNSISRFSTLREQPNVAYAHARRDGEVRSIDSFFDQNIGDPGNPAGGIASSAADMANWLITHLDSGRTATHERLFSPETTEELWKIVRPMSIAKEPEWLKPAQKNFYGYALGFRTYDYRGVKAVGHGGLLTGFVSQIAMVPEQNLGVVVLTNQLSTGAYWAIINHVLDYYLRVPAFDWIAGYKKELNRSLERQDSIARTRNVAQPDSTWARTLPFAAYAGTYCDDLIGRITVQHEGDSILRLQFAKSAQFNGKLVHFHGDLFRLLYDNPDRGEGPFLAFALNPDKTVREARFVSANTAADQDLERIVLTPDKPATQDTTGMQAGDHAPEVFRAVDHPGNRSTFRIFEKPLNFDEERQALSLAYLKERHGLEQDAPYIEPRMVVLHWTAIPSVEKTYDVFAPSVLPSARASISGASALNVSSQFVIDRDGTIFRLLPDTAFARHCIGLNHSAIGVENIGSSEMPLTKAQVKANEALIRYLHTKYPIEYVIGHHEYQSFIGHPLWKETDPGYLTQKSDPGAKFMQQIRGRIKDLEIQGAPD